MPVVFFLLERSGTRKRPVAPANSLKVSEAETRLGGFRTLSRAGRLDRKEPIWPARVGTV